MLQYESAHKQNSLRWINKLFVRWRWKYFGKIKKISEKVFGKKIEKRPNAVKGQLLVEPKKIRRLVEGTKLRTHYTEWIEKRKSPAPGGIWTHYLPVRRCALNRWAPTAALLVELKNVDAISFILHRSSQIWWWAFWRLCFGFVVISLTLINDILLCSLRLPITGWWKVRSPSNWMDR